MKNEFDLSWFDLSKYDAVKDFDGYETKPMKLDDFADCAEWWGKGKSIADKTARKDRQENEQAWRVGIEDIIARNYNLDIKNPHVAEVISHDPEELLSNYTEQQAKIQSLRDQLKTILADALESKA